MRRLLLCIAGMSAVAVLVGGCQPEPEGRYVAVEVDKQVAQQVLQDQEYARQLELSGKQMDQTEQQLARMERQLERADQQFQRQEALIARSERLAQRSEALAARQEKQADRYDKILERWEAEGRPPASR